MSANIGVFPVLSSIPQKKIAAPWKHAAAILEKLTIAHKTGGASSETAHRVTKQNSYSGFARACEWVWTTSKITQGSTWFRQQPC